jgi:hypothetical protein
VLAQHRGDQLNDLGIDVVLAPRQLLGGGRKPPAASACHAALYREGRQGHNDRGELVTVIDIEEAVLEISRTD